MLNKRGAMTSRNEISKGELGCDHRARRKKLLRDEDGEKNGAMISRIPGSHSKRRAIRLYLRLHLLQLLRKLGNSRFQFLNLPVLL